MSGSVIFDSCTSGAKTDFRRDVRSRITFKSDVCTYVKDGKGEKIKRAECYVVKRTCRLDVKSETRGKGKRGGQDARPFENSDVEPALIH